MTDQDQRRPLFSVIIPTRNRPALFSVALQSVLDQNFRELEIIVINDGSSEEHAGRYCDVLATPNAQVRLVTLVRTERGHGQSYALNFGVAEAKGDYVCFLDDDDQWTDPEHLGRVAKVIAGTEQPDLVLSNQQAFRDGVPLKRVTWIEDLQSRLRTNPDTTGAYTVSVTELLRCQAHCHLNSTVVSRKLYLAVGGLDEGLRYECDRDFYLRAIDRAELIKFLPNVVSRHNIPNPDLGASMSTAESELSKRLYQMRVFDKAILFSMHPELRLYAMQQRDYTLGHVYSLTQANGLKDCARYYQQQAVIVRFMAAWRRLTTRT